MKVACARSERALVLAGTFPSPSRPKDVNLKANVDVNWTRPCRTFGYMKLAAKNIQFRLKTVCFPRWLERTHSIGCKREYMKIPWRKRSRENESSSASEMKNMVKNNSIHFYPHRLQIVPTPPFIRRFSNKNKTLRWEPGAGSGGVVRRRKVKWRKCGGRMLFFDFPLERTRRLEWSRGYF